MTLPTHLIYGNGELYGSLTGVLKGVEHYYDARYSSDWRNIETPTVAVFFLDKPAVELSLLMEHVFTKHAHEWELRDFDESRDRSRNGHAARRAAHREVKKVWRKKVKDELLPLMMDATGLPARENC